MIRTEAETWDAIADTLEMTGDMPPYTPTQVCNGLCAILYVAWLDCVISTGAKDSASERVHKYGERTGRSPFLFPPRKVRPRIALARKFANQARKGK